jgi:hypothetical protein
MHGHKHDDDLCRRDRRVNQAMSNHTGLNIQASAELPAFGALSSRSGFRSPYHDMNRMDVVIGCWRALEPCCRCAGASWIVSEEDNKQAPTLNINDVASPYPNRSDPHRRMRI